MGHHVVDSFLIENTFIDMTDLQILFQDEHLVAINKPHGLLVHRSKLAKDATVFALQEVRNMVGQNVYPVHRLDRKTSGVLLFALNEQVLKQMQEQFASRKVDKTYWAIVRGYTEPENTIDYALTNESGKEQDAVTRYKTIAHCELDVAFGKHSTSRYSLVEVKPETGRMHQIRKHFAHIFHPIIGDRPHGCNKQNKLFLEKWSMDTMMLHARQLTFNHPVSNTPIKIEAPIFSEFKRMMDMMHFKMKD